MLNTELTNRMEVNPYPSLTEEKLMDTWVRATNGKAESLLKDIFGRTRTVWRD